MLLRGAAGGDDRGGEAEHGVLALVEGGRARVVGLAGHVDPPAAVRPDVAPDTHGVPETVEGPALLDVELDEGTDPGEGLVVASEVVRGAPGALDRLGHRHAVGVAQPAGAVGGHRPGDDARPGTGDPEAGPLLVGEVDDADGSRRLEAPLAQAVQGGQGADHTERAVEGTAVGDGVEVRADDDPGGAGGDGRVGVAPPRPLVAHPVDGEVEATCRALPGEPLAQVVVGARPGVAAVPPGRGIQADALEVVPHPPEGKRRPVGCQPARHVHHWTKRRPLTGAAVHGGCLGWETSRDGSPSA